MSDVCLTLAKEFKSNKKLCVLVLAVDRASIFLPFFTDFLPPPSPPQSHPLSVTSCWYLVTALGPVGVHVPLETWRGTGGRQEVFSNFCMVSTSLCIFWIANTVFSGLWGLVELCVLPFEKPEFYHSLKQI